MRASRERLLAALARGLEGLAFVLLLTLLLGSPGGLRAEGPGDRAEGVDSAEVERWIDRLGASYEESTAATAALERIGPAAVPALVARLATADDDLRWDLVNVLGALGSPEALEPLVEAAVHHGEVHARWRAYWAIAAVDSEVDDRRAVSLLTPYLEHSDPEVRWRAATALAFLEHPSAVSHLEAGLSADEAWRRWEAVNGLASVHGSESWRKVAQLATEDAEASVRQEAVMTLWKLGERRARQVLVAATEDASPQVRWRALAALAEVVPELRTWAEEQAARDPAPEVRRTFEP